MTSHLAWSHGFQPDSGCGRLLTSSAERNCANCRSGTRLPSPSLTSASWSMQSPNSRRPCLHHQTTAAGSDTLSIVSKHHRQFTVDLSSPHRLNGKLIFVLSTTSCLQLQSAAYWCCTAPASQFATITTHIMTNFGTSCNILHQFIWNSWSRWRRPFPFYSITQLTCKCSGNHFVAAIRFLSFLFSFVVPYFSFDWGSNCSVISLLTVLVLVVVLVAFYSLLQKLHCFVLESHHVQQALPSLCFQGILQDCLLLAPRRARLQAYYRGDRLQDCLLVAPSPLLQTPTNVQWCNVSKASMVKEDLSVSIMEESSPLVSSPSPCFPLSWTATTWCKEVSSTECH